MWLLTVNQGLRKMQRRHSSNTDSIPPERGRSQVISPEASVDEGGVFESLKAESASPPAIFSGLPASPFPAGLVLGSGAGGGDVFIPMPAPREEAGGRGSEASTYHHRQPHHHFHHGGHRGSLLQHVGADHRGHGDEGGDEQPGTPAPALSELKAVICWLQRGLPFILILLAKVCFQHKLGIAVCIGMASTFAYANATLREQVSLKEKRSVLVILWLVAFLAGNTLYVLYTFSSQQLYNSLIFLKPNLETLDFFDLLWIVGIADFILKYITVTLKCLIVVLPKIILAVKSKGTEAQKERAPGSMSDVCHGHRRERGNREAFATCGRKTQWDKEVLGTATGIQRMPSFWLRWSLANLPGLASNHHPPNLHLLSS
ncbi:E3 ubiquitin-protein ligase RNFT2 isoform X2 [Castor canadensis]|uniref:E3 ubiquitin-protein ligase RNFT2 isoform X2 n=1 Tax=Castor canadensis TaxID=51338 RepID=A0AC58LK54_CASCN